MKAMLLFSTVALPVLFSVTSAQAETICEFGGKNEVVCSKAVLFAHEMNSNAPKQVSNKVVLKSADSIQTTVRVNGEIQYSREQFEKAFPDGMQTNTLVKQITSKVCGTRVTREFLNTGGSYRYVFKLTDGSTVADQTLSECSEPASSAE